MSDTRGDGSVERKNPRYNLTAHVEHVSAEDAQYQTVQNISLGGVCIHTPMLEPVGTKIDLRVVFPDLDVSFEARGEVVWTNESELMDMGVRFIDLAESDIQVLERYIELVRRAH